MRAIDVGDLWLRLLVGGTKVSNCAATGKMPGLFLQDNLLR